MEFGPLFAIGACAFFVLVVGWLVVSFSAPGRMRTLVEWISASAMFAILLSLFIHLTRKAAERGNAVAMVAFGFLCLLFGSGLALCLLHAVRSLIRPGESGTSATN